jgi:hypothetical protein
MPGWFIHMDAARQAITKLNADSNADTICITPDPRQRKCEAAKEKIVRADYPERVVRRICLNHRFR